MMARMRRQRTVRRQNSSEQGQLGWRSGGSCFESSQKHLDSLPLSRSASSLASFDSRSQEIGLACCTINYVPSLFRPSRSHRLRNNIRNTLTASIARPTRPEGRHVSQSRRRVSPDSSLALPSIRPQLTTTRSVYRRALKLSLDWSVHRYIWRGQAMYIRSLFEAKKDVRDPRQQRVGPHPWLSYGFSVDLMVCRQF